MEKKIENPKVFYLVLGEQHNIKIFLDKDCEENVCKPIYLKSRFYYDFTEGDFETAINEE